MIMESNAAGVEIKNGLEGVEIACKILGHIIPLRDKLRFSDLVVNVASGAWVQICPKYGNDVVRLFWIWNWIWRSISVIVIIRRKREVSIGRQIDCTL